jgi:hypothetical protein
LCSTQLLTGKQACRLAVQRVQGVYLHVAKQGYTFPLGQCQTGPNRTCQES